MGQGQTISGYVKSCWIRILMVKLKLWRISKKIDSQLKIDSLLRKKVFGLLCPENLHFDPDPIYISDYIPENLFSAEDLYFEAFWMGIHLLWGFIHDLTLHCCLEICLESGMKCGFKYTLCNISSWKECCCYSCKKLLRYCMLIVWFPSNL